MQASNRPSRIQSAKPRLSETHGASTMFAGKTDFEVGQARRRKENKPVRHARHDWGYGENEKTNVGARPGRYAGESL